MHDQLFEILLAPEVIALSAAIIALLYGLGKIPIPKSTLEKNRIWRRILPVLPLVFGVAGSLMFGCNEDVPRPTAHAILLGLWSGFVAAHGRKIFKRVVIDKLGMTTDEKDDEKEA
ncbi:MAG TPA: hypothetical protein VMW52_01305 [Phycisphaerae bacterium]|nr:hypothetical protein [Phycisphaerae bacterium]